MLLRLQLGWEFWALPPRERSFRKPRQLPLAPSVNVTQHHNNLSRDGLFIDPAFTPSAAANLARDVNFDGTIVGNVYAQPLYVEGGPDNRAKVIAVTESDNVYALDAITGTIIWQRNVGTPAGSMGLISTSRYYRHTGNRSGLALAHSGRRDQRS